MSTAINQIVDKLVILLSKFKLITIIVSALLIQIIFMYLISKFVFPDHPGGFQFRSITEHFITAVIVAPIIETYIFQKGIIDFTRLTIKASKLVSVLLSATAFAFTHTYSIQYVAVTFIFGMLYGIIYLSFIEKKADAFWHLTIIHALYNLFAFVMNNFVLSHI